MAPAVAAAAAATSLPGASADAAGAPAPTSNSGAADSSSSSGPLHGCYVKTPYGWGICTHDDVSLLHLQVALNWRLPGRRRVQCAVRRSDITKSSFCAAGRCVLTTFGTGVLLGFRPGDGTHHVQLWGRPTRGRNHAYLRREALLAVLPAAVGLPVETHYGPGTCRGYHIPNGSVHNSAADGNLGKVTTDGHFVIDLPWGSAFLRPESVTCPAALILPLINCFLTWAADLLKVHSGTLARLFETLHGLGLKKLQARLLASAGEAMQVASKFWEEWEAKEPQGSVVDTLKLKADEVLGDPEMKQAFNAGIARLSYLVGRAEGFDGEWVGQQDGHPRCVIKDATIYWHWGEECELEIWGADSVSMKLQGEEFRGTMEDGVLKWTDGDQWSRLEKKGAAPAEAPPAIVSTPELSEGNSVRSDLELIQRSLGDLRRIISGGGLEGDVEEAMSALTRVASNDSEVQHIVEEMQQRRELILDLRGKVLQSKTGQVLQEGQARLTDQLAKLQETAIAPQLERMQHRSHRFLARLTTDKRVKDKAAQFFSAAQDRLTERWNDPEDPQRSILEAWVTSVKERVVSQLGVHRAMLVESLSGLNLQQLDIQQLIANSWDPAALEVQLERSLLQAIRLSGTHSSGTELLDRFESAHSLAHIPELHRTYQTLLSALGNLNIEVPPPIAKLLEAQASGQSHDASAWKEAIVDSLDDDTVVSGATELVKKGEQVLSQFQDLKGSKTVAKVFEHLEKEDLERELLKRLHGVDPHQMLKSAEGALSSVEARELLISQLKDACLDFILKILPAINIEKISGNDNGCDWEISDISFSDFHFRKENVHIALGNPAEGQELLRMSAWDISAHFRKLKVAVKQTHFPFMLGSGVADAKAEKMSVAFAFKLQQGSEPGKPVLEMSTRSVLMESLELSVGETNYAVILNALSYLFADHLKGYACQKISKSLDEHVGTLVGALNSVLVACTPLLSKIGLAPALPALSESSPADRAEPTESAIEQAAALSMKDTEFPEILWADPGRSFAVRV